MHPAHLPLACLALGFAAEAGVIQGVVIEHLSGRPLARARVQLNPVPKSGGDARPIQLRAGAAGYFSFAGVPDGLYLLTATRAGYLPAAHGQRRPTGQGAPIQVSADSDLFSQLAMWRMGAIAGRVLDENGIGIEGVQVIAYRARLPLRASGRATSDDRGAYRIPGLGPGRYWVRNAAATLDDGSGRLPTFGPESRESLQARVHQVVLDGDTPDADIRAEAGALFRLNGLVQCSVPDSPVTVTLSSETGRAVTRSGCNSAFAFEGLAPAVYEVFATKPDGSESGFIERYFDRSAGIAVVRVMPPPAVEFDVRLAGSSTPAGIPIALSGYRQDLTEAEIEHAIETPRSMLAAGHWEMNARVGPGQYVESIVNARTPPSRPWKAERPTDSYDVLLEMFGPARVRVTVSDHAAEVSGKVTHDKKPAPGAPVFLWPVHADARRSLHGPRQVLSDVEGRYRFEGLPPGEYRLVATFDLMEVDEASLDEARAVAVRVDPSQRAALDLPLWIAP